MLKSNQEITIDIQSNGCDSQETEINYLEHVEIQLNMDYTKRGDLSIDVTSAMGKGYIHLRNLLTHTLLFWHFIKNLNFEF